MGRLRCHRTRRRCAGETRSLGEATPINEGSCAVRIPTSALDWAIYALAALHAPFTIQGSAEAIAHATEWGKRLTTAASA